MIQGAAFKVLTGFVESNTRSFVELCEHAGYPTDLGGYYLRQLIGGGYVEKRERGIYAITPKGKARMAISYGPRPSIERPRLLVLLVAEQDGKLVVLRRTTQPYIGAAEWLGISVVHGEPLDEAAERTIHERLGAGRHPKLVGFFRRIDMHEDTVFDDKLFAVHMVTIPKNEQIIAPATTPGTLLLLTEDEVRSLAKPSRSLIDILDFVRSPLPQYTERVYHLSPADLEE